jgi:hypothetical protein
LDHFTYRQLHRICPRVSQVFLRLWKERFLFSFVENIFFSTDLIEQQQQKKSLLKFPTIVGGCCPGLPDFS